MKKVLKWLFEQTAPGKWVNSYKTHIGFCLIAVSILLQASVDVLAVGVDMFPGIIFFSTALEWVAAASDQLADGIKNLGAYVAGAGLWHDKLKRS